MKKLLIVMVAQPLNKYYYQKYGLNSKVSKNYKVEFWNLLAVENKKLNNQFSKTGNRITYNKNFINIKNFRELKKKFSNLPKSFFYLNLGFNSFKNAIFDRILNLKGGKKVYLRVNPIQFDLTVLRALNIKDKIKLLKLNSIFYFFRKAIKVPIAYLLYKIKFKIIRAKPIICFAPNMQWFNFFKREYPKAIVKKSHDYEYELYKNMNKNVKKKSHIVFIDQEQENAYDRQIEFSFKKKKFVDKKIYWNQINTFLSFLEKKLNTKAIIAAHHRRNINYIPIKRKFEFDKTVKLIQNSKLVVAHDSTAIHLAILFHKPIVLIYNNAFKLKPLQFLKAQKLKKLIGSESLNLDDDLIKVNRIKSKTLLKVDKKKYNFYINHYLKCNNFNKIGMWKIVLDGLNKLEKDTLLTKKN